MMAAADRPYVLFLAGPSLPLETIAVPRGASAVWCKSNDEVVERAMHLQPRCVFLDHEIAGDVTGLAVALRRVTYPDTILAVVGRGVEAGPDVDVAIDVAYDVAGEVARLVRFTMGQSVRAGERVRAPGRALVDRGDLAPVETDVIDLSEEGIRVTAAAGLPDEARLRVTLNGRELTFEGRILRRGPEAVAYKFADVTPRARASLRAFLVKRMPPPLQVIPMKRTLDFLEEREIADLTTPKPTKDLRDILDFCEREIVRRVLDRHGGNRTRTAKALGISRQALQQKLARFRAQAARHTNPAAPSEDDDDAAGSRAVV